MQTVSCPSCGAEVHFRSHASVLAVCEYCHSTILKDADAVRDVGKMSAVLEDYTPIQIGTAGVHDGVHFTVVGRIQQRYSAGTWNEWYLLFDDASTAWLGDSSGLYTLTRERSTQATLPVFGELAPGKRYTICGEPYTAAEIRNAECIAGQGELPFKVGAGWRIQVADFRNYASFVTLDYTDGPQPVVYQGVAVTLDSLKCQLLRDDDAIAKSAGKYRGKLDALDCPSCGSGIQYVPGAAAQLVCPACHAQLDASGPEAQVLAIGKQVHDNADITLELGASAKIGNVDFTVIGMMRRADDEGSEWNEYLLYNARAGFFWLVETDDGWSRANVLPNWPSWASLDAASCTLDGATYRKLYDYGSQVVYAAGAFNWKVAVGDSTRVFEFEQGQTKLAAELTNEEMTWSRSVPVAYDQMTAWFGAAFHGGAKAQNIQLSHRGIAKVFMVIVLVLNAIPMFVSFSSTLMWSLLGCLALFLPAVFLDKNAKNPP